MYRAVYRQKKAVPIADANRDGQNNPGNVLLSHGQHHSTIAAEELDGRVRKGNGYFLLAMVTGKSVGSVRLPYAKHGGPLDR